MAKIPIRIHMISNDTVQDFETFGIYDANLGILKYVDCDSSKTHVLSFDINKDKILNCKLKEMNQILSFNLKTISLEQQEHLFRVSYEIIVERETISKIYYEINY